MAKKIFCHFLPNAKANLQVDLGNLFTINLYNAQKTNYTVLVLM